MNSQTMSLSDAVNIAAKCLSKGEYKQVEEISNQILQAVPDNTDAKHLLGIVALQRGEYDEAISKIEECLKQEKSNASMYNNLGTAYEKTGDFKNAVKNFKTALELENNNVSVLSNLGSAYINLGEFQKALDTTEKAIEIAPNNISALINKGNALVKLNQFDEALAVLNKAQCIDPNNAHVMYNVGNAYFEKENYDDAAGVFKKLVELSPHEPKYHLMHAEALKHNGNIDVAKKIYKNIIEEYPDYLDAMVNLGVIYLNEGENERAREYFEIVLDKQPKSYIAAIARYHYGVILRDEGKFDESQAIFAETHKYEFALNHLELSINSFIHGNTQATKEFLQKLNKSKRFINTPLHAKIISSYSLLLSKLVDRQCSDERAESDLPSLYCVGESHCLPPANQRVVFEGSDYCVNSRIIMGCKAWSLGNLECNTYKSQFEYIFQDLPEGSLIVLMPGEIDCRFDEGILQYHRKSSLDLEVIISKTAISYVDYVVRVAEKYKHKIMLYGVPAQVREAHLLEREQMQEVAYVIEKFNHVLREEASKRGLNFLDVFLLTNSDNGFSNGEWHLDGVHMQTSVLGMLLQEQ